MQWQRMRACVWVICGGWRSAAQAQADEHCVAVCSLRQQA